MGSNLTREFYNSALLNNSHDECLRQKIHFERNKNHAIAICGMNVLLCLAALVGNSSVLMAIWKTPFLHSPANILLASLAVSDFAVGLITQPLLISFLLTAVYGLSPPIYRAVCQGYGYTASFLCGVSLCTITAIGFDRLLALQLHLRYNSIITIYRVSFAATCIWVCVGVFMINYFCLKFEIFTTIIATIICVIITANFVIYLKIYRIVQRHETQIRDQQQEVNNGNIFRLKRLQKSIVNTFLFFIFLICCYVPQISVLITVRFRNVFTVYFVTTTIVFLNSSLNPLLYCWRVGELRLAVKQLLCR